MASVAAGSACNLLKLNILHGNLGTGRQTAEVEDDHHRLVSLIRLHRLILVGHVIECGQGYVVVVEEGVGAVVVGIRNFHGAHTGLGRLYFGKESVLLLRVGRNGSDQLHLALPLRAADSGRHGELEHAAFEACAGIQAAAPVGRTEPGLLKAELSEQVVTIGVCNGGVASGLFSGQDSSVIYGVVFQGDTVDGDHGIIRIAAEIQHDADVIGNYAGDICCIEDCLLSCLQGQIVIQQHHSVIGVGTILVHTMNLHFCGDVHVGVQYCREVIGLVCGQGDIRCRNNEYLCLPAFGSSGRKHPGVFGAAAFHGRIGNRAPARSVIVRYS